MDTIAVGAKRTICRRAVALCVAAGLLAVSCGVSADLEEVSTPRSTVSVVGLAEVPPSLYFLGELAAVYSPPLTAVFDSASASVDLGDGSLIEVPDGAFREPTPLTVVIVDVELDEFVVDAPQVRVYSLSTEAEVELVAPLVLEVPKPTNSVQVSELVGDVWVPVEVVAGSTTRIEIAHFTERKFAVADAAAGPLQLQPDIKTPTGVATADALLGCMRFVAGVNQFGGTSGFGRQLAYRVCAEALVNVLTPNGSDVELECVGDQIDTAGTIEQAIKNCQAGPADEGTDTGDGGQPQEPDPSTAGPATPAEGIDGRYQGMWVDLSIVAGLVKESVNSFTVTIEDERVTGMNFEFSGTHNSVTSGQEEEVTCVADVGFRASVGPGVVSAAPDGRLIGDIDVNVYQTFGVGNGCEADLVTDETLPFAFEAVIAGDTMTGALTDPDGSIAFTAER